MGSSEAVFGYLSQRLFFLIRHGLFPFYIFLGMVQCSANLIVDASLNNMEISREMRFLDFGFEDNQN